MRIDIMPEPPQPALPADLVLLQVPSPTARVQHDVSHTQDVGPCLVKEHEAEAFQVLHLPAVWSAWLPVSTQRWNPKARCARDAK